MMQERYLGDSHDFIKFALLRHLAATTGKRLGVNWYLTRPEDVDKSGNNDGEKRHHLAGGSWRTTDPELFDRIGRFDSSSERSLANIQRFGILPDDVLYHEEMLSGAERMSWHAHALRNLADSDLVFLDPDNGFEVPSATRRTAPKYALYREAVAYLEAGKTVVSIQFARQCDPVQRAMDVRARLKEIAGPSAELPVIRARLAPNILFLTMARDDLRGKISQSLRAFAERCAKVDLID